MMISNKMNAAINEQIGYEFGAMMQYVAIGSHFVTESLHALAAHFYRQAEEERDHAMRFVKYVLDAGGRVEIPALTAPRANFENVEDAIKLSLGQEKMVTERINKLMELAIQENDFITQNALGWFVNEQLEEVSSMQSLLKLVQLAGKNLLFVEEHLNRQQGKAAQTGASDPT